MYIEIATTAVNMIGLNAAKKASSKILLAKKASAGAVVRSFSSKSNFAAPTLPPFDHSPSKYTGPSFEEVERLRKTFLSPGLLTYYQKPVMIVEGKKQYVWDDKGKRYLDFFGGIGKFNCCDHV